MSIKNTIKLALLKLASPKTVAYFQVAIAVVTLVQAFNSLRSSEPEEETPGSDDE